MSDQPIVGTSLTSSGLITKKAFTDELVIKQNNITEISHDYENGNVRSLPSSKALSDGLDQLDNQLKRIDPNNNFFKDNTVITLPLISPSFDEDGDWVYSGWTPHDGQVTFVGTDFAVANYVGIPSEVIPFSGYYFLLIDIPRLDSGKIVLYDRDGSTIKEFDSYGKFAVELYVANADIAEFKFVAEGVFPGEAVTITSIMFNRITPRLKEYVTYLFSGGEDGGELTYDMMMTAIQTSQTNIMALVTNRVDAIEDSMNVHTEDFTNPHGVTPAQIGAAVTTHTHTPLSIGAAQVIHTHEPTECGAAEVIHTHIPQECGAAPLVHTHLPVDLGAADRVHSHTPTECGSAPEFHTHTAISIGAAPIVHDHTEYTTPSDVTSQIQLALNDLTLTGGGSGSSLTPMSIMECVKGILPDGYENSNLSAPVSPILLPYLVHQANGPYDYYEGKVSSNIPTLLTRPIQYAFKKHLTVEDHTVNVAAFSSPTEILAPAVLIEYQFHIERTISALTIFKDSTDFIGGVPVIFDLYVDNKFVMTVNGINPTTLIPWNQSAAFLNTILASPVTGKKISILVKQVTLDTNLNWGTRVEFLFNDVADNTIKLGDSISLIVTGITGSRLVELFSANPVALISTEVNTPLYVFMDIESVDDLNSGQLRLSPIPLECDDKQSGVPLFLNRFADREHGLFGTISTTSENTPDYPLDNIYKDDINYWKSGDTVVDATITHVFPTEFSITGYKLVFSNTQLSDNTVPDKWELIGTVLDDLGIEEDVILDVIDLFYPSIPNNGTKIYFVQNDLLSSTPVVKLKLRLQGTKGQSAVGVCQFIPLIKDNFYHIYKNQIITPNTFPLGKLEYIRGYNDWYGFVHSGLVLGKHCHLPIDGMKIQPNLILTHRIPNPFNSTKINIALHTYTSLNALSPSGNIDSITPDEIVVSTYAAGAYSLAISRLW